MPDALADGLNLLAQLIGGAGTVLEVDARDTDSCNTGNELGHGMRGIRIAGLNVNCERRPNDARYVADRSEQLIVRQHVPIRKTMRPRESGARGRNRLCAHALDQASTTRIPSIR